VSEPIDIRLAGYAPADSSHGRALDLIKTELLNTLGNRVKVGITYNIMDSGRPVQDLLADVEAGVTTLCNFSCSYLADRVPEMGLIDLPFVFGSVEHAHHSLDGALGRLLDTRIEQSTDLVSMGYWDNGFRHLSNRNREIHTAADCRGLRIRLQPNWAHESYFSALGTQPVCTDLRDGIAMLKAGELDAQENPLANVAAYGLDDVHPHITMTGHVYGARGLYASKLQLAEWPDDVVGALRAAVRSAIAAQRADAAEVETALRRRFTEQGTSFVDLDDDEAATFRTAAKPVLAEGRARLGADVWKLLE
jgi:TRAP-type transport system periplasmic protein